MFVTGTGTGVGKTVVTAAIAALGTGGVAVLKPAQTGVAAGEGGDLADVRRLAGPVTVSELGRFPDPLAPAAAARRARAAPVRPHEIRNEALRLAEHHDLVLVEGAGGLLVRFDEDGGTLADAAASVPAEVLVVTPAGLGALNTAALTAEALRVRGLACPGLVIGAWPAEPDLACRCNLRDLPGVTALPLLGALPEGVASGSLPDAEHRVDPDAGASEFRALAHRGLAPRLGGAWNACEFTRACAPVE